MNKRITTKKANAIFLATILVAGTIALSSPSFMTYAQAVPKYGKEANSSQNNKCTNINLNFPGLDISLNPPPTDEIGASSLASDGPNNGPNGPDGINFDQNQVFVCINNNDNSIRGGVDRGDVEEPPTCKTCFTDNLSQEELNDLLELLSPTPLRDLEGLCDVLSNPSATNQDKLDLIIGLFNTAGINDEDTIVDVLECLRDLGIITGPIPSLN